MAFRKIEVKTNFSNSIERTYTKSDVFVLECGNQHYLLLDQKQSYDVSSHHFCSAYLPVRARKEGEDIKRL